MKSPFYKIDGTKIENVAQYIKNYIDSDRLTAKFSILIGCDSLPSRYKSATYVTVICIYREGRGAHIIYNRERKVRVRDLYERLWAEVEKALEVAVYLRESGIENMNKIQALDVNLHLDLNPDDGGGANKSNSIIDAAVGYVTAMGFSCSTKPNAPAASYCADWLCRGYETRGTK